MGGAGRAVTADRKGVPMQLLQGREQCARPARLRIKAHVPHTNACERLLQVALAFALALGASHVPATNARERSFQLVRPEMHPTTPSVRNPTIPPP